VKSIRFEELSFGYAKGDLIIEGATFELSGHGKGGRVGALMGPSGCGKTTLLRLILGLERPTAGTIVTRPRAPLISYVPQDSVMFEHLSPLENARYFASIKRYRKNFEDRSFEELTAVLGLARLFEGRFSVSALSGGERQRLSLLRALSIRPDFVLLDEPLTGLDSDVKRSFLMKLRQLVDTQRLLIIYVTHHRAEAELVADDVLYMRASVNEVGVEPVAKTAVDRLRESAPSVNAAQTFSFPDFNTLRCALEDGVLWLQQGGTPRSNAGEVYLVVGSSAIKPVESSPIRVHCHGGNALFTFLQVGSGGPMLIATRAAFEWVEPGDVAHVEIDGVGALYDGNGSFLETVRLGELAGARRVRVATRRIEG
jgi:ABC-type sugar transport system ATPase subunit